MNFTKKALTAETASANLRNLKRYRSATAIHAEATAGTQRTTARCKHLAYMAGGSRERSAGGNEKADGSQFSNFHHSFCP